MMLGKLVDHLKKMQSEYNAKYSLTLLQDTIQMDQKVIRQ